MKEIFAHITQNTTGQWRLQSLDDHANGVADLAAQFAAQFGMSTWGCELGLLHDQGKRRSNFQCYIKRASGYDTSSPYSGEHTHAAIGALSASQIYAPFEPLFSVPIAGHHAGLYDYSEHKSLLQQPLPSDYTPAQHSPRINELANEIKRLPGLSPEHFHHLTRMLFSCLVDADFLDTERAMNPAEFALRGHHASMQQLQQMMHSHIDRLTANATHSAVNDIRAKVQQQCISAAAAKPGFFSLTVPTGGGKTLASVLWAIDHAVANNLRRIIIAIPYTSIIIQTAAVLKRIFGEENVLEHHSNFDPGDDQKAKLATENWDYPI
ncbi:MAG: CRISPR-associated endonuclease Cas3'', partial [Muribaculaceae bacterium]